MKATNDTVNGLFGTRLRLVRASQRLSLDDLASVFDVSRQYIHQIETGERPASLELAEKACGFFQVKKSFFEQPIERYINSESVNFRHRATTPDYAKRSIVSKSILLAELLEQVEMYVKLPKVDFPKFEALSADEIEIVANKVRSYYQIPLDSPISNLFRVVENAGAVACTFSGHDEKIDAFSVLFKRPLVVVVGESAKSPVRIRFDVAHELGHLILHQGIETGSTKTEREADRFASAFIFPREQFLREMPRTKRINWQNLKALKRRWKMSLAALIRRSFDLGVFDEYQYRSAMIHLSKTGQRKIEHDDIKFTRERPEVLNKAFSYLQSSPNSLQSLLNDLDLEPEAVGKLFGVEVDSDVFQKFRSSRNNIVHFQK